MTFTFTEQLLTLAENDIADNPVLRLRMEKHRAEWNASPLPHGWIKIDLNVAEAHRVMRALNLPEDPNVLLDKCIAFYSAPHDADEEELALHVIMSDYAKLVDANNPKHAELHALK